MLYFLKTLHLASQAAILHIFVKLPQPNLRNLNYLAQLLTSPLLQTSHTLPSPLYQSAIYKHSSCSPTECSSRKIPPHKQESQWIDLNPLRFTCQPPCCLSVKMCWPIKSPSHACDVYSVLFLCLIFTCPGFFFPSTFMERGACENDCGRV